MTQGKNSSPTERYSTTQLLEPDKINIQWELITDCLQIQASQSYLRVATTKNDKVGKEKKCTI